MKWLLLRCNDRQHVIYERFKIMDDKKWKPIGWFECPECRGELEVFTEAEDDYFFDDDPVRCTDCGWEGRIIVVDDEAWVKEID